MLKEDERGILTVERNASWYCRCMGAFRTLTRTAVAINDKYNDERDMNSTKKE
jgi:hypothetical protein